MSDDMIGVAEGDMQADDYQASRTPFIWWDRTLTNEGWVLRYFVTGAPVDAPLLARDRSNPDAAVDEARAYL